MSRFLSKDSYPEYYKPVNITYVIGKNWFYDKAWLAVNDDGRYIWTLDGTDKILLDDEVIDWFND